MNSPALLALGIIIIALNRSSWFGCYKHIEDELESHLSNLPKVHGMHVLTVGMDSEGSVRPFEMQFWGEPFSSTWSRLPPTHH